MSQEPTTQQADTEANGKRRSSGPSVSEAILIGRLTANPELRYTSNGTAYARFSVATNDRRGEVSFHDVLAWKGTAEAAARYLDKGRLVFVSGELRSRAWEAEDGTKRRSTEIIAQNLQFLTPRPQEQVEVEEGA